MPRVLRDGRHSFALRQANVVENIKKKSNTNSCHYILFRMYCYNFKGLWKTVLSPSVEYLSVERYDIHLPYTP